MHTPTKCKVKTAAPRRVVLKAKMSIPEKARDSKKELVLSVSQSTTELTLIHEEKFIPTTNQRRKRSSVRLILETVLRPPPTAVARPKPRRRRLSTKLRLLRVPK